MAHAILRFEKYKRSAVYGVHAEMTRSAELHYSKGVDFLNSDIDWTRTNTNEIIVPCQSINKRITQAIQSAGVKERADSVVSLGFVITASADFFNKDKDGKPIYDEKADSYFKDALQAVVDDVFHGDWSKLQCVVIHKDETTLHLQGVADCITTNDKGEPCLSAKRILSGPARLREIQNNFYDRVGRPRGLERGELVQEGSPKKKHKSKAQYRQESIDNAITKLEQAVKLDTAPLVECFKPLPLSSKSVINNDDLEYVVRSLVLADGFTKAIQALRELESIANADGRIKTLESRLDKANTTAREWFKELERLHLIEQEYKSITNMLSKLNVSQDYTFLDVWSKAKLHSGIGAQTADKFIELATDIKTGRAPQRVRFTTSLDDQSQDLDNIDLVD